MYDESKFYKNVQVYEKNDYDDDDSTYTNERYNTTTPNKLSKNNSNMSNNNQIEDPFKTRSKIKSNIIKHIKRNQENIK
jgi:hypothetical protein